jgi:hypothetical protein
MNQHKGPPLKRRAVFATAGAAGALAGVATLLPGSRPEPVAQVEAKPQPDTGGGYQETAHVLRYYQTTRV